MPARRILLLFALLAAATVLVLLGLRALVERRGAVSLLREGEAVFWGRGRCSGCHPLGGEGGGTRGPDLGRDPETGQSFRARAGSRVPGRSAVDYVLESLVAPDAFTVEGFPSRLMPSVVDPPVSLSEGDVRAVVVFLLAEGTDVAEVSDGVRVAQDRLRSRMGAAPPARATGDPARGRQVFMRMKCASCHEDARLAPPLAGIGAVQSPAYLRESVVAPDAVVVHAPGNTWSAGAGQHSRMPSYGELLSASELDDLVAYLSSLR